jgi:hypothetical protein
MKYIVSALGTEALQAIEIEANSQDEATDKYYEMWAEGGIQALDYEIEHYTVTENGQDTVIRK